MQTFAMFFIEIVPGIGSVLHVRFERLHAGNLPLHAAKDCVISPRRSGNSTPVLRRGVDGCTMSAMARSPEPTVPSELRWLFPEIEMASLDSARDRNFILSRMLERGRPVDVKWALQQYGAEGVHQFLRTSGCAELSPRTLSFWRAYFQAEDETWQSPPDFRRNKSVHWPPLDEPSPGPESYLQKFGVSQADLFDDAEHIFPAGLTPERWEHQNLFSPRGSAAARLARNSRSLALPPGGSCPPSGRRDCRRDADLRRCERSSAIASSAGG
jgi:hypothetical protein